MQVAEPATEALETNAIYCGDCLEVLSSFPPESVDLVYVDPPFGSGEDYEIVFKDGVEVRHFKDRWIGGKQSYLDWMRPRIRAIHQVLKQTGSFYLHCDAHLNGYLREMCDIQFHEGNFRNEIVWKRTSAHTGQGKIRRYGAVHDTILFYSKGDEYMFNPKYTEYDKEYEEKFYRCKDPDGRHYMLDNLTATGTNHGESGKPWRGIDPSKKGNHWKFTVSRLDELEKEGRIWFPAKQGGVPRYKRYRDEVKGRLLQDIWMDVKPVQAHARERRHFPTQKPIPLLKRIISISSNPGDLVLDPMCGCGTTLIAAQELKRSWIGVDISPTACRIMVDWLHSEHVSITEDDIIGLPRSIQEVKAMVNLHPIEFQNWVCAKLKAVSTTPRGNAPRPDGNVDGWIMNTIPIQVKGSDGVGYAEVQRFETTLQALHSKEGYMIAFSFSKPAYEEAYRARNESRLLIDLLELEETRVENPRYPKRPEVYTILKSKITNRVWGTRAQATIETSGKTHEPNLHSWANKTLPGQEDVPPQKMQGSP